jgi:hypothetical protein
MTRLAVICLLLTWFAYQAKTAWSQAEPNQSAKTQSLKADKSEKSRNGCQTVILQQSFDSVIGEETHQPQTQKAAEKSHDWMDRLNACSTLIIAIFTILLFFGLLRQISTNRDTERAWVLANGAGNPRTPLYDPQQPGHTPGINYLIEIAGNSPARIVRERFRCRIIPVIQGVLQLESVPTYTSKRGMFNGSTMRAPGDKYYISVFLESGPLTANEFRDLQSGNTALCVYGCIDYRDVFNRQRMTQVCCIYNFAFGGVLTSPDGTVLNPAGFRQGGPDAYNQYT